MTRYEPLIMRERFYPFTFLFLGFNAGKKKQGQTEKKSALSAAKNGMDIIFFHQDE